MGEDVISYEWVHLRLGWFCLLPSWQLHLDLLLLRRTLGLHDHHPAFDLLFGLRLSAILIFLRGQISVCGGYMAEFTHAL